MQHNTHYEVTSSEGCEVFTSIDDARGAFLRFQQDHHGVDVSLIEVHRHGRRKTIALATYGELEVVQEPALQGRREPDPDEILKSVPRQPALVGTTQQKLATLRKMRVSREIEYARSPTSVNRLLLASVHQLTMRVLMSVDSEQAEANQRRLDIPVAA